MNFLHSLMTNYPSQPAKALANMSNARHTRAAASVNAVCRLGTAPLLPIAIGLARNTAPGKPVDHLSGS